MIDLDFHPTIRDMIVQYACPESLLALRGASRELRRMCDKRLFDHVQVEITFDGAVVVRPFRSNLGFEWKRLDVKVVGVPSLGVPAQTIKAYADPEHCTPERTKLRQYVQACMETARLIDVRRLPTQPEVGRRTYVNAPFFNALSQLGGTVRSSRKPVPLQYRDYSRVAYPRPHRLARPIRSEIDMGDAGDFLLRHTPHDTRSAVVHLLDTPDGRKPERGSIWVQRRDQKIESEAERRTNQHVGPTDLKLGRDKTLDEKKKPFAGRRPAEVTVVGGTEHLRLAFGLSPAPADKLCYELDVAAAMLRPRNMALYLDVPPPYIRFVTPEAYLLEVGAERFAAETQLDPSSGPAAQYLP
jgi:hypothetical protein